VLHWLSFEPTFEKIEALFFSEIFPIWKSFGKKTEIGTPFFFLARLYFYLAFARDRGLFFTELGQLPITRG